MPGPPLYRPQLPRLTALPSKLSVKAGVKLPLEAVGAAEAAAGARRPAPRAAAAAPARMARRRSEKRRDLCCKGVAPWGMACGNDETRPERASRRSWRLIGVQHGGRAPFVCFAGCGRAASRAGTRYPRMRGATNDQRMAGGDGSGTRGFTSPKVRRRRWSGAPTGQVPSSTRSRQQSSAGIVILPHACEVSCRVRAGRCCPAGSAEGICVSASPQATASRGVMGPPLLPVRKVCRGRTRRRHGVVGASSEPTRGPSGERKRNCSPYRQSSMFLNDRPGETSRAPSQSSENDDHEGAVAPSVGLNQGPAKNATC